MPRLPHAASRLVRRSTVLTLGEKAVWQELAEFPDTGCWLRASALGDRLALAGEVVERARRTLLQGGLAKHGIRQPSEGRRGRPAPTWFAVLPDAFVPTSRTPTDADLSRLAEVFDAHLRGALGRTETRPSGRVNTEKKPTERSGNSALVARSAPRGEGGRGEGSPSSQPVVLTTVPPLSFSTNRDPNPAREAPTPRSMLVPARSRTLAGGGTTELDRTIDGERGARLTPRDLQHQLDGWLQRVAGGSR